MNSKNRNTNFIVIFLFFAVLVVGFVFACTDAEYDYNQQIARGFISRDAVFFSLDNLSYREAFFASFDLSDLDGGALPVIDTTPKAAVDASFVLENKVLDNGQTAVESLFMSGSGNYLVSLHNGLMRGVAYKGRIIAPPLLSGRFFTEEECLADKPLAVIGRNFKELTASRDGKQYLTYMGREYEVIGVTGLNGESPIDDIVFVNIGSLTPEEQIDGMFYIDCGSNNEAVYNQMQEAAVKFFGCGLKLRETPKAFIDVVAGGMYMKSYLKILMLLLGVITFASVLIQSTRKRLVEIAVMKVQGIELKKIFSRTTKKYLVACTIGSVLGITANILLIVFGVFSLPVGWLIRYCATMFITALIMMILWILIVFVVEWRLDPKGVIQKV